LDVADRVRAIAPSVDGAIDARLAIAVTMRLEMNLLRRWGSAAGSRSARGATA